MASLTMDSSSRMARIEEKKDMRDLAGGELVHAE
jgi:hypothetical protein